MHAREQKKMDKRKILFFVIVMLFTAYCTITWFVTRNDTVEDVKTVQFVSKKTVLLFPKDACSVLQVFTERPKTQQEKHEEDMEGDVLQVFTERPKAKQQKHEEDMEGDVLQVFTERPKTKQEKHEEDMEGDVLQVFTERPKAKQQKHEEDIRREKEAKNEAMFFLFIFFLFVLASGVK